MSGSALSPWAEVQDPLSVTARLAKLLNCSLPSSLSDRHPETMICLRNVSASRLATLDLPEYKFTSLFGPSVDNVVVTQDFKTRMSRVSIMVLRYVVLCYVVYEIDVFFYRISPFFCTCKLFYCIFLYL